MPGRGVVPISEAPLGVIDLLDGAFAVIRQRSRVIVAIVAGLVVPVSLFQAWITRDDLGGSSLGELLNDPAATSTADPGSPYDLAFVAGHGLGLLVTAVGGVAVSRVIVAWLGGEDLSAAGALRFTARRAGAVLGAFALVHLIEALALVLLVVPILIAIPACSLTSPVLAAEGLGPLASIRRSAQLVRRRPFQVVGLMMLLGGVHYGVNQAVGTLPSVVAVVVGPDRTWPLLAVSNTATSLILVPVTGAAMCLLYLDIRFRTEGLDLQRRIERHFGPAGPPGAGVAP